MLNSVDFETVSKVAGIALGIYELVSRGVPTSKTWSIIGLVLKGVKFISDKLDRKKKSIPGQVQ